MLVNYSFNTGNICSKIEQIVAEFLMNSLSFSEPNLVNPEPIE